MTDSEDKDLDVAQPTVALEVEQNVAVDAVDPLVLAHESKLPTQNAIG